MRYFRACLQLLERGVAPTLVTIAKLRISPESVWAFQKRYPELLGWVHTEFVGRNKHLFGPVQFRFAQLPMQGSAAHGDLYLKSLSLGFSDVEVTDATPASVHVQQVYLVPRPEYPKLEAPANPAAPIPTFPRSL